MLSLILSSMVKMICCSLMAIPNSIHCILTWSIILDLNIWIFGLISYFILTAINFVIREKFVMEYAYNELTVPRPANPNSLNGIHFRRSSISTGFNQCCDKFLADSLCSTRIFKSLDEPVFQEILRHAHIKRLLKDDILLMDEENERSFQLVVRGNVDLLVIPDSNQYGNSTLIKKVGPSGRISSYSTISNALSEAQKLFMMRNPRRQQFEKEMQQGIKDGPSSFDSQSSTPELTTRRRGSDSACSSPLDSLCNSPNALSISLDYYFDEDDSFNNNHNKELHDDTEKQHHDVIPTTKSLPQQNRYAVIYHGNTVILPHIIDKINMSTESIQHNIVARATEDSLLVVIPKEAFIQAFIKFPMSVNNFNMITSAQLQEYGYQGRNHKSACHSC